LQVRVRQLQRELEEPGLYARDRQAFTAATEALTAAQAELATAEERWLELELLREEIEGG
jgi:ATP-binding cassette subfamily F protein uup